MEGRRLVAGIDGDVPPRWAVWVVKACVIGLLLLPVLSIAWAVAYRPTESSDLGPVALGLVITLAVGMGCSAAFLTAAYPPVPQAERR